MYTQLLDKLHKLAEQLRNAKFSRMSSADSLSRTVSRVGTGRQVSSASRPVVSFVQAATARRVFCAKCCVVAPIYTFIDVAV